MTKFLLAVLLICFSSQNLFAQSNCVGDVRLKKELRVRVAEADARQEFAANLAEISGDAKTLKTVSAGLMFASSTLLMSANGLVFANMITRAGSTYYSGLVSAFSGIYNRTYLNASIGGLVAINTIPRMPLIAFGDAWGAAFGMVAGSSAVGTAIAFTFIAGISQPELVYLIGKSGYALFVGYERIEMDLSQIAQAEENIKQAIEKLQLEIDAKIESPPGSWDNMKSLGSENSRHFALIAEKAHTQALLSQQLAIISKGKLNLALASCTPEN
jgi:hypothetical protein